MQRPALVLAVAAVVAAMLPTPGLYLALGLGVAAIGTGWIAYRQRATSGFARLAGATAITVGGVGLLLGVVRIVLVVATLDRLEHLVGAL